MSDLDHRRRYCDCDPCRFSCSGFLCECACHTPPPGPLAGSGERCGHCRSLNITVHLAPGVAGQDVRSVLCNDCLSSHVKSVSAHAAPSLAGAPGESAIGKEETEVVTTIEDIARREESARRQGRVQGLREAIEECNKESMARHTHSVAASCASRIRARLAEAEKS